MAPTRPAAVAGLFYSADPGQLASSVERYLSEARGRQLTTPPKALIAPHAGYLYSGPVAGSAFATVAPLRGRISRVVVIGPSHFVAFAGIALSGAEAFDTPLGAIPVDGAALDSIRTLPQVRELESAHAREHALEVELPFLQLLLGDFSLVPLVVGEATVGEVREVLERLWGGDETLIVVSSDLSHYLDYETARRTDGETCRLIESLERTDIGPERACGCRAINGFVAVAGELELQAETLDLRNSGDTAGDKDRVVGYGAWVLG